MAKSNEPYTEEEQKRIAVNRYQMGERPFKICESVGRSRVWLRKWIRRYDNSDKNSKKEWFRDESRAPKNVHRKTDSEVEQLIINVRKSLMEGKTEDTKYRCIGAEEIQFRMHELGYLEYETPSLSTIKRIIKRNGMVVQKRKQYIRCKSKKRLHPSRIQLKPMMSIRWTLWDRDTSRDMVRPASLHLTDVAFNRAYAQQYAGRSMDNVIEFLIGCWTENAIPNYLQMDNGAYFIGDLIHSGALQPRCQTMPISWC